MSKVQVFDPPMCCSTGVCGPQVDPALVRFAADLEWLRRRTGSRWSASTSRRSPPPSSGTRWSRRPSAAVTTRSLLLDGKIAAQGRYPAREVLAELVGVAAPKTKEGPDACRAPAEAAARRASAVPPSSKKCC